ncbi:MAG: SGNH/GDSL hydrolase family protein, partial [Eubacteriales bacterium]|nr:SGNH/GDSL hydrolase family protein [Eubacteriales bacterium]
ENFSPITLWEEYGITSYIRGSAQQLIWHSYYLLEETLQYEKPKVVVFNVQAMKYDEPQSEAYNRMTLDGMKLSRIKIDAAEASMTEEENLFTYIFPFFRFHSRWSELNADDVKYMFGTDKISHNGYLMRVDVKPATQTPVPEVLADDSFSDVCYEYLDRMTALCKENGIALILIKSPSIYPYWYDEWDEQIVDYAEKNGLTYINFLDLMDECGIDMRTDTYDSGLHLNLAGAEKLSTYFGNILRERYGLEDHRGDAALAEVWSEKVDFYYDTKAAQEAELAKYGYLKSLTVDIKEGK